MTSRYNYDSEEEKRYIPDTSVIINGRLMALLKEDFFEAKSVMVIHKALLAELEHQANEGEKKGLFGLNQLKTIRNLCIQKNVDFSYEGRIPRYSELSEIDALIRNFTWQQRGTLITSDNIQNLSAQSIGINTVFLKSRSANDVSKELNIEKFFDEETMSVHLKQGTRVYVKKGTPGNIKFLKFSDDIVRKNQIIDYADEILEKADYFPNTFIEIDRKTSTIVQYEDKRIVITRPPFSDGWEITAVRPVKKMTLTEYNLSNRLIQRLEETADGILVAGSPGAGKTTFTRALALFYYEKGKIIKTIESPRDLDLNKEITQYSKNFGTNSEIHDILLLSRPDYTIFDEIRDVNDFHLYTDLRLAGIGLIGVIHSSTAIDAIQRFIGRLELGVIPSVLDTILYIDSGQVSTILEVKMTVKVPSGLIENDLARPVIEVRDFNTGDIVYEMYTFGEQTVVIPVGEGNQRKKKQVSKESISEIEELIGQYASQPVKVIQKDQYGRRFEIHSAMEDISRIVGKKGATIRMLENILRVKLDVNKDPSDFAPTNYAILNQHIVSIHKRTIIFNFPKRLKNRDITFFVQREVEGKISEFFTGTTSKTGKIKVATKSEIGQIFLSAFEEETIQIFWK
jgi:ATPase